MRSRLRIVRRSALKPVALLHTMAVLHAVAALLTLAALFPLASACGRAAPAAAATADAAAGRRGGILVVGWSGEPMGVNELLFPANYLSDELMRQLFLQLVREQG